MDSPSLHVVGVHRDEVYRTESTRLIGVAVVSETVRDEIPSVVVVPSTAVPHRSEDSRRGRGCPHVECSTPRSLTISRDNPSHRVPGARDTAEKSRCVESQATRSYSQRNKLTW